MAETRNPYRVLVRKPEENLLLGRHKHERNIGEKT